MQNTGIVVDIQKVTGPYLGRPRLLERIKDLQNIREWLIGKKYRFIYSNSQLPVSVEFRSSEDALAFKLKFDV